MPQNYLTYQDMHHRCRKQKSLSFSDVETAKTDDTLIYHDNAFYKVMEVDDPCLIVQKIKTKVFGVPNVTRLPWAKVGVARYQGPVYDPSLRRFNKEDVKCKAILCGGVISSMPSEWVVM